MKRLGIALALLVFVGTAYADQCDNVANCIDNPTTTTLNFQTANGTGTAPGFTNYTNGVIYNDAPMWMHYLGTGAEADPGPTSFSVQGVHHYAALTINAGQTITVTSVGSAIGAATDKPNGGFVAYVRGTCTIAGTIAANGVFAQTSNFGGASSGGGGAGAANGVTGNSTSLPGDGGAVAIATAGGQGVTAGSVAATAGSTPTTSAQNDVIQTAPSYGNCGGATGGNGGSGGPALGGQGGGCVVLICNNINFTGTINVAGAAGGAGGVNIGAGGGGGGGFVILAARTLTNSGTITTTAGAAGTGQSGTGSAAAAGGAGWSKTFTLN